MRLELWKATFRKQIKEMWDLFLLSLFCLNANTKVRLAMSHFLSIMKCNLRKHLLKQVSYNNKNQCFLKRISRRKLSSHNPWSARLKTYKVFFEFILPVMSYLLMHPFYFGLSVLWLKSCINCFWHFFCLWCKRRAWVRPWIRCRIHLPLRSCLFLVKWNCYPTPRAISVTRSVWPKIWISRSGRNLNFKFPLGIW